jgi:hypothetical protein
MPSSVINSDDGVISGTSGLKSVGGDDGNLVFQSKGTETARINTDKQIVAAAGTASLPIYSTTGDLNTGIFFPAADTIAFAEGGVEAMRIDSSGNVGIGTTSPGQKLDIVGSGATAVRLRGGSSTNEGAGFFVGNNAGTVTLVGLADDARINGGAAETLMSVFSSKPLLFYSNSAERMRIDSSGNLLVGTTSGSRKVNITYTAASGGIYMETSNNDSTFLSVTRSATVNVQHKIIGSTYEIVNDANGVSLAFSGTSWGSLSDERKKDIIEPIENAAEKVSTLRAVIGKYKTDDEGTRRALLIAQDVQAVLPEAVVENSDGDLILQYTDTIPLLVAAIKELKAELDTVKAELATLKEN